ncbi:Adenylate cyclase [Candidatus Terasakiella magnetica]|uniref:Adenylate cyclase n=1 Tax=Candidatus Terasakiella magnetica TaxID=1867952 RepID=A0A1C3REJ4_9PROT|nr:GAF domain-containing protein [Candidatus Terasakiella magnetica]SCA55707.1 Adenylate cyclase [Candidatus Terasakiella magnetica]
MPESNSKAEELANNIHVTPSTAEMVLRVSHDVARATSLDEQLRIIMEAVTEATNSDRGTLFLNDSQTNELYSRIALGDIKREIRILNNSGIAGAVYTSGDPEIVPDAYADKRFNHSVDHATGYKTRNILCAPVRTVRGDILGVAQTLNKHDEGEFTDDDLAIMQAITTQASIALQGTLFIERMEKLREQEAEFLNVVSDVSSEINLGPLLQMIMNAITKMLQADRSTLFLNDEKTNELYTQIGQGLGATNIRLPNHLGIAGAVFTSAKTVNIPYAYADLRFNPAFDKQTGYFTRSILCCPVLNKDGKVIGVTQVLNKKGGPFSDDDEQRLKAFTSQIAVGLENAQLFADVQQMKNYNESMLESMSNAVVTFDEEGTIVTCNAAGLKIFQVKADEIIGQKDADFFVDENVFIVERLRTVRDENEADIFLDAILKIGEEKEETSVNITTLPLLDKDSKPIGTMIMMEDISSEKRMKSTMSRYMDPGLADQLMGGGEDFLGGQSTEATVLFSDVASFTTLSEELGAQGIVKLLNEYFTLMVDCLNDEGGMLDKFIGDAIMAIFGTPFPHEDDPDRAVRCAIQMMVKLNEFNAGRKAQGLLPIDIRIGLNTDNVVSGNIGSPKRMDYTVIGDGVNLAARLESGAKQYGAHILISEFTFKQLKGTYRTRAMDHVVVKGKTEPVGIYEVLDYHTEETFPNMVDGLAHFRDGIECYHKGAFDDGIEKFKKVLELNPKDKASEIYIERCEHLKETVNPDEWDGVWVMTSK